jgi:AraC-like DNA-binding protein
LKSNNQKLTGVLHTQNSAKHYQLRRYFPAAELQSLVEQFWLVDWDLRGQAEHIQQNLPDPNMHLVINRNGAKVLGPVSKKYAFKMQGQGRIIGIKFKLGVLVKRLSCSIEQAVDQEFAASDVFQEMSQSFCTRILQEDNDQAVVDSLSNLLAHYLPQPTPTLINAQSLAEHIKIHHHINQVSVLADLSQHSVRNIQRLFKGYIGLSPKWLIRKYRLHQALALLDNQQLSLAQLAIDLDYADQSHLIKDFNDFLDVTPKQYRVTGHMLD